MLGLTKGVREFVQVDVVDWLVWVGGGCLGSKDVEMVMGRKKEGGREVLVLECEGVWVDVKGWMDSMGSRNST